MESISIEDDIENRFPDLVIDLNQDSDELFDSLLSSNNINFARSRTCLMEDFQLHRSTPQIQRTSTNSLQLTASHSKSRTSLQNNAQKRFSVNIQENNTSSTPLKSIRPSSNSKSYDSTNLSKNTFLKTPTNSRHTLSVKKYSPVKLVDRRTENSDNADCYYNQNTCMKEKRKDLGLVLSGSSPFHNITFRNKSNQKKENCNMETEHNSLANKFQLVSACNSSSVPCDFVTIESPNQQRNLLKTPVGRCSQSFLRTPNTSHKKIVARSNNKTPTLSSRKLESTKSLTGVKQLESSLSKRQSLQLVKNKYASKRISVNQDTSIVEDDDLPCTQPISEILLRGVVAYIEIRADKEYRNEGVKAELESLGAKCEKNFTKKVTHCFFQNGRMSTYKRAIDWNVPLVCVLWIEACKAELRKVPLKGYEPHGIERFKDALSLYRPKKRIRRPVTDSKVLARLRKTAANPAKTATATPAARTLPLGPPSQTGELIEALHSVAGDLRKATHQFEKILTSPILQKRGCETKSTSPRLSEKENSEEIFEEKRKKRNKKLIFVSSSDEDCNKVKTKSKPSNRESSIINDVNPSGNEIRVSYDSDDLLVYAKKQAANIRCSAPPRLLTSRKCKKLLTSCQKAMENKIHNQNSVVFNPTTTSSAQENSKRNSKNLHEKVDKSRGNNNVEKDVKKLKKRRLMVPAQVLAAFEQDSSESISEASDVTCPYKTSPNKKHATARAKFRKPQPVVPVLSDWESDDSLTRAARRESSALFVKKEKKAQGHRFVPTIVCTSLPKSDVETVASIAVTLGRFAMEPTVSERTTHVVTSSTRRTMNLLKGVARGCWVLNVQWVYASLEAGKWLHEERFELTSFSPAVKQARLERQAFGPEFSLELFNSVGAVYVCRTTVPPAADLTELLRLCGATVVSSARAARILVGTARPFSPTFNTRQPLVVTERWVLDSVTRLTMLNPHDYAVHEPED